MADDQRDDATAALERLVADEPAFDHYRGSLRLAAPDGSQTLLAVVRRLDERGITVHDIALHKPTLDDVFLTLTGRGAAEAEAETEAGKATAGSRRGPRGRKR